MRKEIYLKNFNINSDEILNNFTENPYKSTVFFKNFLETKYVNYAKEIKEAVNNNAEIIHIKNIDQKNYNRHLSKRGFRKEFVGGTSKDNELGSKHKLPLKVAFGETPNVITPYDGEVRVSGIEELICHMYGVIGVINSFPISYKDEDKNIIRAVAPRRNSHNERSSQSPHNDLDWHVDAAYRPITEKSSNLSPLPDYLIFGIVHKGHENLPIVYISLNDILNQLSYQDILIGRSNEFTVTSADSFSYKIVSKNLPLLVEHANGYYSRIKMDAIPETQRAAGFLNKIREIVDQKSIQNYIYVDPSDIVILNNKAVLHKRDSYSPKWDGKDRYFIRIYSVKDINQGILANSAQPWIWV